MTCPFWILNVVSKLHSSRLWRHERGTPNSSRRMSLTTAISCPGSHLHTTSVHNYCVFLLYFTIWTSVKIYAQSMKLCLCRLLTPFAQNLWIDLANVQGLNFSSWLQCIGDIDGGNLWDFRYCLLLTVKHKSFKIVTKTLLSFEMW